MLILNDAITLRRCVYFEPPVNLILGSRASSSRSLMSVPIIPRIDRTNNIEAAIIHILGKQCIQQRIGPTVGRLSIIATIELPETSCGNNVP